MKNYTDIFFDLDKTLWDFHANTTETFRDLYDYFLLSEYSIKSPHDFFNVYEVHNTQLWEMYRKGAVTKDFLSLERFKRTLSDFKVNNRDIAESMSKEYIKRSPLKTKLMPFAIEALEYLFKKYRLHIITNGFSEVQFVKIEHSGLGKYFNCIITSEEVGCKKPNPHIFQYSIDKAGVLPEASLMIGDDIEVDILGASDFGIDQVFYNPEKLKIEFEPTFQIFSLKELCKVL